MPNRRCAAAATFGAGVATAGAGHRYNDENDAVKSAHSPNLRCPPLHFSLDLTWMPLPIIPSKCPVVIPRPATPRSRQHQGAGGSTGLLQHRSPHRGPVRHAYRLSYSKTRAESGRGRTPFLIAVMRHAFV